jgi:CheY-like chemotaxis protein
MPPERRARPAGAPEVTPAPPDAILIVEDNQVNALVLRAMLERNGYACVLAVDGREGVEMSAAHRPRLILMDLQMPRLDGFAAAAEIRRTSERPGPAIVAVTANVTEEVREACERAGFAAVITKPVMMEELLATVRRLAPAA